MSLFYPTGFIQTCKKCGCTDDDCSGCIKKTGSPCYWVKPGLCSACHQEAMNSDKPWGYDVEIELRVGMVATEVKEFHKQGTEAAVRRWARLKSGFVSVVKMTPYTRKRWNEAYGHGDQRM